MEPKILPDTERKAAPLKIDRKIFSTLFFSMFATITGVGIVVPLLPVYAHHLGAAGLYIGLIFGAFSLSRTVLLPLFGRLSDRRGRKPFIITGLLAYALASVAFIFSSEVMHLIVVRFFQGIASAMIMPVVQAYVGDITPAGREGFTMGLFNMSVFFGLSLGPAAGGLLNDHFSLNAAFVCMGSLALLGFLLCLVLLPPSREEKARRTARTPMPWRSILADRVVGGLVVFRLMYTAAIGMIWSFLPVLADVRFHLSSSRIGVLVMIGVFVSGVIQVPMGYLADRVNRTAMVVAGGLLAAAGVFAYDLAATSLGLYAASLIFGIGGGTAMPALMALAVDKGSETRSMGSVISLLTMGHSLGMLCGSVGAGLMMDWFDLGHAFSMGGVAMILGIAVFWICMRRRSVTVLPEM